jgi:twinkle protein
LGKVLEIMDCAVHNNDVQQIILDNLQFMMPMTRDRGGGGGGGLRQGFEKFEYQDLVIHHLRNFATERSVNIILVIHPRKELESAPLGLASIFGSAKATQEADMVLILQVCLSIAYLLFPLGHCG